MGAKWFGHYTQYIILIFIAASIFYSCILSHILFYFQQISTKEKDSYITNITTLYLIVSTLIAFVFVLLVKAFENNDHGQIEAIYYCYFYLTAELARKILFAAEKWWILLLNNSAFFTISICYIFSIGYGIIQPSLSEYFTTIAVLTAFSTFSLFYSCKFSVRFSFNFLNYTTFIKYATLLGSYAKWTLPSTIFSWFGEQFLLLSYGWINGVTALGNIRAIQNIISILNPLLVLTENLSTTTYAKLATGTWEKLQRKIRQDLCVFMLVVLLTVLIIFSFGDQIIQITIKEGSTPYAASYAGTYFFLFAASLYRGLSRAYNKPDIILSASIAGSLISLICYKLLLIHGQWGFLLSLICYHIAYFMLLFYGVRHLRKVNFKSH